MTKQEEVLLKALIAMIQADGIIAPEETGLLAQVLGRLDMCSEDIALAGSWLIKPQHIEPKMLREVFTDPQEREFVTSLLLELAGADSNVDHQEITLLNQLVSALSGAPE
jgi:uncharacterized tellurite resistance protein B-like protein